MGLSLARALRLTPPAQLAGQPAGVVAFAGAGGKTTAIFQLAHELPAPVIITTTTHFGAWQASLADRHVILSRNELGGDLMAHGVTLVTGPKTNDQRLAAPGDTSALWLHDVARSRGITMLIEADGARQKPLKAPADHEPAIPPFATLVVVLRVSRAWEGHSRMNSSTGRSSLPR